MSKTLRSALAILITFASAGQANAQAPTNPAILQALQNLQESVNTIASNVTNITSQGTVVTTQLAGVASQLTAITSSLTNIETALTTAPAIIATGSLFKPSGFSAGCSAQNAGTSTVILNLDLVRLDGQVQQSNNPINLVLAPGTGNGFGLAVGSLPNHYWCRFTMVSGSSHDIRANLSVVNEATGLGLIREAR